MVASFGILGCVSWRLLILVVLGTERCNEALEKLGKKYDIVVNIQGDEPLIEPEIIDGIVKALQVKLLSFGLFTFTKLNFKGIDRLPKPFCVVC